MADSFYKLLAAADLAVELNQPPCGVKMDEDGNVVFIDDTVSVPSDQIEARAAEMAAQHIIEYAEMRRERDRLLAETDWVTLKAIDASNDGLGIQLPQVWVDYRQALRDLPANTVDPANPVWPEKPQ